MKKTHTLLFAYLLLFSACREEQIQPQLFGSLVGTVLAMEDNIAIVGATVSTNPPTSSLQTDELGRFTIDQIEAGTYTIRAEKEGFVTEIENVTVFQDQTANVILRLIPESAVNSAPGIPENPVPFNGSTDLETEVTLGWNAVDANEDELTYDIILCTSNTADCDTVAQDIFEKSYTVQGLTHSTTYFWQVRAKDGFTSTNSNLWSFTVREFPDLRYVYAKRQNNKYDIFASDAEQSQTVQLTNAAGDSWRPRMNPQRTKIAFLSNMGIETHLYVMNRDGSGRTRVTDAVPVSGINPLELGFTWSPNGADLVYPAGHELYKIGVDGVGLEKIADAPDGTMFAEADWSGAAQRIAVRTTGSNVYESDMFLLSEEGVFLQQIYADIPGREDGPRFSLDGNSVLYTHDVSGYEAADGRQLATHILLKNLSDNSVFDISEEGNILAGTNDLDPCFSPDGAKVIFVNTNNDGISQRNILIMDLDGDDRETLFHDAVMPEWK